jgi:CDP-glycerol glycerophosphotransferase (TagB/SpsB family)
MKKFLRVVSIFGSISFIPILDLIIPKNRKVVVFTGNRLAGINGNPASVIRSWSKSTKSRGFDTYLLSSKNEKFEGLKTINPLSLNGILVLLRSYTVVISHGPIDLFWFSLCNTKRRRVINLWHGMPLKKIGPWKYWRNTFLISASETERNLLSEATGTEKSKIIVTGYPRTDQIFKNPKRIRERVLNKLNVKNKAGKWILYAPTFRNDKKSKGYLHNLPDFSLNKLTNFLSENNLHLIIRAHINDQHFNLKRNERILTANFDLFPDIEPLYFLSDILITDYSSIIFEYSLLNRPMIGISSDLDEYSKTTGFLLDYKSIFPGTLATNWKVLRKSILEYIKNPRKDSSRRKEFRSIFNKYRDGKSTERVMDLICN